MARRDVVLLGASAGGIEPLREIIGALPADFPATVLVILHVPASGTSALPRILDRAGALPVRHAAEGDALVPGEVLVAPPDHHLVVVGGGRGVTLSRGPRENGHRPAVDVTFRSAAKVLGPRVISVVLSGALDDGSAGSVAVKLRGGVTVCQDPEEALHSSMPASAIGAADVNHVLPVSAIPPLLLQLTGGGQDVPEPSGPSDLMELETAVADMEMSAIGGDGIGTPSGYTCPDCHGALNALVEGDLPRFRCRVGHAWSQASLMAQQSAAVEGALWTALRSLEEKAALTRDMADKSGASGHSFTQQAFRRQADEAHVAATTLRDLLVTITATTAPSEHEIEVAGERLG